MTSCTGSSPPPSSNDNNNNNKKQTAPPSVESYVQTHAQTIQHLLQCISTLTTTPPSPQTLSDLLHQASSHLATLKSTQRSASLLLELQEELVRQQKSTMQDQQLVLQNLAYERAHLQREMQACQCFVLRELGGMAKEELAGELDTDDDDDDDEDADDDEDDDNDNDHDNENNEESKGNDNQQQNTTSTTTSPNKTNKKPKKPRHPNMDLINSYMQINLFQPKDRPTHRQALDFLACEKQERMRLQDCLVQKKKDLMGVQKIRDKKQKFLSSLPHRLETLEKATLPLQEYFATPLSSRRDRYAKAWQQLSPPLYTLFCQLEGYRDAFIPGPHEKDKSSGGGGGGTGLEMQVDMIPTTTTHNQTIHHGTNSKTSPGSSTNKRQKRKRLSHASTEEDADTTNTEKKEGEELDSSSQPFEEEEEEEEEEERWLEPHPWSISLKLKLKLKRSSNSHSKLTKMKSSGKANPSSSSSTTTSITTTNDKDVTELLFEYLPNYHMITVHAVKQPRLLLHLFPNDGGVVLPHGVAVGRFRFKKNGKNKNGSSGGGGVVFAPESVKRPYRWAQWLGGLVFLPPAHEDDKETEQEEDEEDGYDSALEDHESGTPTATVTTTHDMQNNPEESDKDHPPTLTQMKKPTRKRKRNLHQQTTPTPPIQVKPPLLEPSTAAIMQQLHRRIRAQRRLSELLQSFKEAARSSSNSNHNHNHNNNSNNNKNKLPPLHPTGAPPMLHRGKGILTGWVELPESVDIRGLFGQLEGEGMGCRYFKATMQRLLVDPMSTSSANASSSGGGGGGGGNAGTNTTSNSPTADKTSGGGGGGATLKAVVQIHPQYPAYPPQWVLQPRPPGGPAATAAAQGMDMETCRPLAEMVPDSMRKIVGGSAGAGQQKGGRMAVLLHDNDLRHVEWKVNAEYWDLVMVSGSEDEEEDEEEGGGEEVYDWLLAHELRYVMACWNALGETGGGGGAKQREQQVLWGMGRKRRGKDRRRIMAFERYAMGK